MALLLHVVALVIVLAPRESIPDPRLEGHSKESAPEVLNQTLD